MASDTALVTSARIITAIRRRRSTQTPAARPKASIGANWAAPIKPICIGEASKVRIATSGSATTVTESPTLLMVSAVHNQRNERSANSVTERAIATL